VFFVMGYVDGESLAQRVTDGGPLPAGEVVGLLRDVAAALHEAHRLGIVHRDVKAENILVDRRTGRAMVTDFGIARVAEAAPLTATGLLLGTVQYMSPEHVVGETVDARSDVYSLGVVAFHALTARFPFQSESASAVLVAHVTKTPPKIRDIEPSIPPALAEIVDRCLAKEPAQRFQSAGELGDALSALSPSIPQAPRPEDSAPAAKESDVLLSDREARAVWDRAASLQAQATGSVTPLPPPSREAQRQPVSPSSAYRLDVVRESAREAGIGTEYVDRALAERGLGEKGAAPPAPVAPASTPAVPMEIRDMRVKPFSRWAGAPSAIEYEVVVDGEISERDFEWLVEPIRSTLSDVGTVGAIGRSFTWSATDPKRRVHVAVQMRNDARRFASPKPSRHSGEASSAAVSEGSAAGLAAHCSPWSALRRARSKWGSPPP
jgi:serine/threonine-protein kinase